MFDVKKYYPSFVYPSGYKKLKELNLTNFDWWYFFPDDQLERRFERIQNRYPDRKLIPFARRDDNDDMACFEIGKGEKVEIVHDLSSPGFEQRGEYDDIWHWAKAALDELIDNEREYPSYE